MQYDWTVRLGRAYQYAAVQHANQRRKGELAEPYINHLIEVADLVATATNGADPELVMAAVLHDTIEDTSAELTDLERLFGYRVAAIVNEVTDNKALPKAERKRLQIENAGLASVEAQTVKIADKISNLRSLAISPPINWKIERRKEYVEWAAKVIERCHGANQWLEAEFATTAKLVGLA